MDYIAHKTEDGRTQSVLEHLTGTAELAKQNAVPLMQELAYAAGLAHDIGKYSQAFQERIQNGSKQKYEHALGGALEYWKLHGKPMHPFLTVLLAYCIAGHHTGLPDGGQKSDSAEESTLRGRLQREPDYKAEKDYQAFCTEVTLPQPECQELCGELMRLYNASRETFFESFAFFTRYLFSCLTDADHLDTERFCRPDVKREMRSDLSEAERAVRAHLQAFHAETPLQMARSRLQAQAFSNARTSSSVSILQMPVGSGKTLCSLEIALQKALSTGKKRTIYVIPYTSIIEQTASQFEALFGADTDILQHHSNYDFEKSTRQDEPDTAQKLRNAAENWDAPVIVTTSVQFFESLYHCQSSRLRKLHNMADSVIVFDEIHMLPVKGLKPCLRAVGFLTKYLNSEAIFLSATMPDYTERFREYLPDLPVQQLITDETDFAYFRKCRYQFLGETEQEHIAALAANYRSSLIIVNRKRSARELYELLSGTKFHLSTWMTPHDRSERIAAIKEKLEHGEQVTVVSTSLIEAGVDVDFEAVFRELAGLDNILQSGGRCNREGKRRIGDVFIYQTSEGLCGEMAVRASITKDLMQHCEDIESVECIREYYRRVFQEMDEKIEAGTINDRKWKTDLDHKTGFVSIPFRSYAEDFRMIEDGGTGIVINNCKETEDLLSALESGDFSKRRTLQQYTVSLRQNDMQKAMGSGILTQRAGLYVLSDPAYYSRETGLQLDASHDEVI